MPAKIVGLKNASNLGSFGDASSLKKRDGAVPELCKCWLHMHVLDYFDPKCCFTAGGGMLA